VFWLDTSGWLNTDIHFDGRPEDQDFFLDGSFSSNPLDRCQKLICLQRRARQSDGV